jgi:hypothetical protein
MAVAAHRSGRTNPRPVDPTPKQGANQAVGGTRPAPPPHGHKQAVLRQYAAAYQLRILVETGTQHGHMLAALKKVFAKLYSIELSPALHEQTRVRFRSDRQIELLCGDSAALLPGIIARLHEPALFWLDGHYSPNQAPAGKQVTPILAELAHLFAAPRLGHVIIIDDVRLFRERFGYPPLAEVLAMIEQAGDWDVLIQDDSLRLTPRPQKPPSPQLEQDESAHG